MTYEKEWLQLTSPENSLNAIDFNVQIQSEYYTLILLPFVKQNNKRENNIHT